MTYHLSTLFIILLFLILLAAFFAATEIGMMSINRYKLKHLVKKENKQASRVNQILSRPDRLLSVVLIGNTLANILASTIATLIGQHIYGDAGIAIATALLTLIILVFAEMIPKTFAAIYPQQVAFATSLPLQILQLIFAPVVYLCVSMSNGVLRIFRISIDKIQKESLTGEELRSVVHEAGGLLPVEHKSMLISLLDLEQATVEDIMIPKSDIVGIDIEEPWAEILYQLETAKHTRLPLYRASIDDLVGMIHVRDVLNLAIENELDLDSLLKAADEPYYIPEATSLNIQILNFRKMKRRSSFVVDEYGNIQGLVTMEDILEEIVGEFTTDVAALSRDIIPQSDGSVIVDAGLTLRHLNRLMGWNLPMIGPKTLSGLIVEHLGYIPPAESCLTIENYRMEILKVGDNTIKSIKVFKISKKR
ncbi:HlyC/CorC family transporter [Legionella parisiensis]|uniref:Hemolysin C n=1 Tax=Legionella parisiensis TaxID=45071 RepID=A0A1E5JMH6_9GAMM|nr:HlyC/CorC family transporter [Legionella parisiensis]KTD42565.1 Mg2+ and Co2+ transporter CorB, hemolysin [Legionella parisiensis]OEH45712.1 Hemolysin C [Legionella parisiensis]STX71757.1 Mg2+ and Co2+ transporter CorB, hemolysin [Legionella parisiensis]